VRVKIMGLIIRELAEISLRFYVLAIISTRTRTCQSVLAGLCPAWAHNLFSMPPTPVPPASRSCESIREGWRTCRTRTVRRPWRPLWRPFWLRFTCVTSVLVKKY
jgi:hypothetical protein